MSNLVEILSEKWFEIFMGLLLSMVVVFLATLMVSMLINLVNYDSCTDQTFACRGHQVQLCMNSELYSRTECIQLVGGKNAR